MFKSQSKSKNFRCFLLASAALSASAGMASAQTAPAPQQPIETVVVTGSLIQRSPGDMPTPTVMVSADTIAKTGEANIFNVLTQLPQVQTSGGMGDLTPTNSNFLTSGFGISNVDLRELGAARTLVLIDGRRQVTGSPTSSAVDLNTIPTDLISRVDVVTGGQSATYGSDAISGVVNFILKDDFEGVAAKVQTGISQRGDGPETYGTATLGGNFADGRGNVAVSVSYDHTGAVMSKNRDISASDETYLPGFFPLVGNYGSFFLGGSAYSSYGTGGRYLPYVPGTGELGGLGFNPDGSNFVTANNGFDRDPNRYIQVPVARKVIAETGHYDITNWLTFSLQATYAQTDASQQLEPYPGGSDDGLSKPVSAGGTPILIPLTNAFIQPGLLGVLSNPSFAGATGFAFARRFADLGDRTGTVDRNMAKVTFGFNGALPFGDWKWSSYYEWGRTQESQFSGGYYDKIKMQDALDSHIETPAEILAGIVAPAGGGGAICDDPIARAAGCVPINLFGAGAITPQAAKYVGSLVTLQDEAQEQVANINASGSIFDMPAGSVKAAVGAEYRRESASFVPDAATQAGTVAGNSAPEINGAFDVKEEFAEVQVPLLKDLPFVQYLEVDGSIRYSQYSTAGDTNSWNFGGIYQPLDDLKFRVSESSATRAPNIGELFSPPAQTFPGLGIDPCTAPVAGSNVAANCALQIAALGPPIAGEPTNPTYTQAQRQGVGGFVSGNPNLKTETAHTFTGGAVYTPSWLSGFQATVDFYDIRLAGAIGSLSYAATLNACYNADPSGFSTNIFCQQITRQNDATSGPIIKQINQPTFNLGSIKTSGVDLGLDYAFAMEDLDPSMANMGSWALSLQTTYLDTYSQDPGVPGTFNQDFAGTVSLERIRGLFRATYDLNKLSVTTTLRYLGPAIIDNSIAADDPANKLPSTWYVDLNVSYDLTKRIQVYAGINNLFDNRPPEVFPGVEDTTGTSTSADDYDPIGRFMYTGISFKM